MLGGAVIVVINKSSGYCIQTIPKLCNVFTWYEVSHVVFMWCAKVKTLYYATAMKQIVYQNIIGLVYNVYMWYIGVVHCYEAIIIIIAK